MTPEQQARWEAHCAEFIALEASSSDDDPWLFHGTSQKNALIIVESGFNPRTSYVFVPDRSSDVRAGYVQDCVFWASSFDMALNFACKKANSGWEGFPVIFAARASDLGVGGRLLPDYNTWDYNTDCDEAMYPVDWRDSLKKLGAIAVADCREVPNLQFRAPAELTVLPACFRPGAKDIDPDIPEEEQETSFTMFR